VAGGVADMNGQALPINDIILPPDVGVWPLAPGWWLLLILCIGLAIAGVWFTRRWLKQRRRKTLAQALVAQAQKTYASHGDLCAYCSDINQTLKRYARAAGAGNAPLALTGQPWADWLNAQVSRPVFSEALALAVAEGPYRPLPDLDPDQLEAAAKLWIRKARFRQEQHHA